MTSRCWSCSAIVERAGVNAAEWLERYAAQLGTDPPTTEEFRAVLDLAAEAAHASERVAAPVACWLSARAGIPLERAIELAREIEPEAG
jgi:Domain of unknown function (DUF6457)